MSGFFPNAVRSFTSLFGFVLDLMGDGLRFFRLSIRSHSALSAEVLFLRKQLAFYEERERQPRRLTNSARLSLVLWSHLFDWRSALVIVEPETLIGWHRRGFQLFWKWKARNDNGNNFGPSLRRDETPVETLKPKELTVRSTY